MNNKDKLDGKYSKKVQLPAKAKFVFFYRQHLTTLVTPTIRSIKCKQSPVYGVFDRYFHIPPPIVTKHELGLPFPPRNLPIKFGKNPSTIFLVIVVTDKRTHTQTDRHTETNAGKTYSIRFRGENSAYHDRATPSAAIGRIPQLLRYGPKMDSLCSSLNPWHDIQEISAYHRLMQ